MKHYSIKNDKLHDLLFLIFIIIEHFDMNKGVFMLLKSIVFIVFLYHLYPNKDTFNVWFPMTQNCMGYE